MSTAKRTDEATAKRTSRIAYRTTLERGRRRQTLLITSGPIPHEGMVATIHGEEWEITRVKPEPIIAIFRPEGSTIKQVF